MGELWDAAVERRLEEVERRLARLESAAPQAGPKPQPAALPRPRPTAAPGPAAPAAARPAPQPAAPPVAAAPSPRPALEDLVGGRLLAWLGGAATLLGIAFLLALGISGGWIGETGRTLIGGVGSALLAAVGLRAHARRGATHAARAATGAGIAGMLGTLAVAAQAYDLLAAPLALLLAAGVGTGAVALAIRWEDRTLAAIGLAGGLLAPVLSGAPLEGATLIVLWLTTAAAAAVCVRLRWDWLGLSAFALATPQWLAWLLPGLVEGEQRPAVAALLVVAGFGAAAVAAAVGFELRTRARELRPTSGFLLALNAVVIGAAGWAALDGAGGGGLVWLGALAAVHGGVGLAARRSGRVSPDLARLALILGALLADIAFGVVADGVVLTGGWVVASVALAALAARAGELADRRLLQAGLGGHLAIALLHTLLVDAPPSSTVSGAGMLAVALLAAGCLTTGRIGAQAPPWRPALDALGLAAVAYLTAGALDGPALVAAWAGQAVALAALAKAEGEVARIGALAFLAGALGHALVFEAPPAGLAEGVAHPFDAAVALGAVLLAALRVARHDPEPSLRRVLPAAAALCGLHLASVELVSVVGGAVSAGADGATALDPRQQAQVALSALWSATGLAALVAGLGGDRRDLRLGGLALLLVAVVKVFLFDLATLDAAYRVVSFIALGILLLLAAFAWQRLRPEAPRDLRSVPRGLR